MKPRTLCLRFISIACVLLGSVYVFFLERGDGPTGGVSSSSKTQLLGVQSLSPASSSSSPRGFIYRGRYPPFRVDLLVLIPSRLRSDNLERRKALRTFMAALVDTSQFSLAYYFLLTRKGYSALDVQKGEQENSTYSDMVWADDSIEDYNMVTKVWTELHGMNEYYRRSGVHEPTHWAKFDDDAFVLWDRFFPAMATMPRESLVWCAQGSGAYAQAGGFSGIFCNGPYLFSFDVAKHIGNDEKQKITSAHWSNEREKPGYNDDYVSKFRVHILSHFNFYPTLTHTSSSFLGIPCSFSHATTLIGEPLSTLAPIEGGTVTTWVTWSCACVSLGH